jgi:hypothetical protein
VLGTTAGALAPADGLPAGALALALGAADGGFSAVCAVSPVTPISIRNRICAACDRSLSWSSALPARETTMFRSPWITTSASDTPSALTRFSMMSRACSMLSFDGTWPPCTEAMYVACVPPTRSRPSLGCRRSVTLPLAPPAKKTSRYRTTKIRPSTASCRPGCICPCGGRATAFGLPAVCYGPPPAAPFCPTAAPGGTSRSHGPSAAGRTGPTANAPRAGPESIVSPFYASR